MISVSYGKLVIILKFLYILIGYERRKNSLTIKRRVILTYTLGGLIRGLTGRSRGFPTYI